MLWIKNIVLSLQCFLVLASGTSFTVYKHFCLTALKDVSVILPADGCGMETMSRDSEGLCEVSKMPCCHDEQELIDGQDTFKIDSSTPELVKAAIYSATTAYGYYFQAPSVSSQLAIPYPNPPPRHSQPLFIVFEQIIV